MYWQENDPTLKRSKIVDVLFDIRCRELPVDHIWALSDSLRNAAPWLDEDDRIAIHEIHVAGSQNGWERPDKGAAQQLLLSRRTKLVIRMPRDKIEFAAGLNGIAVEVADKPLSIGGFKTRELSKLNTLFARHIVTETGSDENAFLASVADILKTRGIRIRKALSGMLSEMNTPHGPVSTRSLMLADLKTDESIELQELGIGRYQKYGCGIFIPHKDIDAVKKLTDDE